MATLGEKIKSLRSARQMSLRALELELAKHGGSAKFTAIGKWEQDAARPSRENLKAICEYFNVDPAWLMFGTLSAGDQLSTVMEDVKLLSPRSLRVLAKTIDALRDEDLRAEKTDITSSPQDTPPPIVTGKH